MRLYNWCGAVGSMVVIAVNSDAIDNDIVDRNCRQCVLNTHTGSAIIDTRELSNDDAMVWVSIKYQ